MNGTMANMPVPELLDQMSAERREVFDREIDLLGWDEMVGSMTCRFLLVEINRRDGRTIVSTHQTFEAATEGLADDPEWEGWDGFVVDLDTGDLHAMHRVVVPVPAARDEQGVLVYSNDAAREAVASAYANG